MPRSDLTRAERLERDALVASLTVDRAAAERAEKDAAAAAEAAAWNAARDPKGDQQ